MTLLDGLAGLSWQVPLSSQCSVQLQEVHIFLHPPGIRVSTDLASPPGDEPVKPGREVL